MNIYLRVLLLIALLASIGFAWTLVPFVEWIEAFRGWILSLGALGVVLFIALYVLITVGLGPATALTLSAGLAYGAWGFPLVLASATLAAAMAFLLGRYVARERVSQFIRRDSRLDVLNKAVSAEGWRVVALLRLSPLLPYGVQSYLFSVTEIQFVPYVLATFIGIMPASALFVYIGSLGTSLASTGWLQWLFIGGGLVATAIVVWVIGKRAKQALARHAEPNASS